MTAASHAGAGLATVFGFLCMAAAACADGDITYQEGKNYSLIASANCQRMEQADIEPALACDFHGKKARFYLKEVQALETRLNPGDNWIGFVRDALRRVVAPLAADDVSARIGLSGGSAVEGWGANRIILNRAAISTEARRESVRRITSSASCFAWIGS